MLLFQIHHGFLQKKTSRLKTLSQKVEILQSLQAPGVTQASMANKYGVSSSQISRIVQGKDRIVSDFETSGRNRKRKREGKEEEVSRALYVWFQHKLEQSARLSGPVLKTKAKELAAARGSDFEPTEGWLCRWKIRHNLIYKREFGEKQHADVAAANEWKKAGMQEILEEYAPEDIFNADEFGLYFRGFPDKGYILKGSELPGGKKAKERITAMPCANMTGTEKRPLMIIGNSKRPRSFPNDLTKLPVSYTNSKNAWMTGEIYRKWLAEWDGQLQTQNRHICLLVDNCSAHPNIVELNNIRVKFLPPNTSSLAQPMDMGVIRN